MSEFPGFLYSQLRRIGSKSEGPEYFLQDFLHGEDNMVFEVGKEVDLWQEDPRLQPYLGQRVSLQGEFVDDKLSYKSVHPYQEPEQLVLKLQLEKDTLWLNKEFPVSRPLPFEIRLLVYWPFRGIWERLIETTQIYDFSVERDGKVIWQWSHDQSFDTRMTKVQVLGGAYRSFPAIWMIDPHQIEVEGVYLVRGHFLASDQTAENWLEIRFA